MRISAWRCWLGELADRKGAWPFALLVIVGTAMIRPYFHLHDKASLLAIMQAPWSCSLPLDKRFLCGSPLLGWLGWALEVKSLAALAAFSAALWLGGLSVSLWTIEHSDLSRIGRARFVSAFLSGFTVAIFSEWMSKSDSLVLAGFLTIFFARRFATIAAACVVMTSAHVEQSVVLVSLHLLLVWPDRRRRPSAVGAVLSVLATALLWRLTMHGLAMEGGRSRLDWALDVWALTWRGLCAGDLGTYWHVLRAAVSLAGFGWLFIWRACRAAETPQRLRVSAALGVGFVLASGATDTARVATVLGWPVLAWAARQWALQGVSRRNASLSFEASSNGRWMLFWLGSLLKAA